MSIGSRFWVSEVLLWIWKRVFFYSIFFTIYITCLIIFSKVNGINHLQLHLPENPILVTQFVTIKVLRDEFRAAAHSRWGTKISFPWPRSVYGTLWFSSSYSNHRKFDGIKNGLRDMYTTKYLLMCAATRWTTFLLKIKICPCPRYIYL